jgi:hypothetical protein
MLAMYSEAKEGSALESGDGCALFSLLLHSTLVPPCLCSAGRC